MELKAELKPSARLTPSARCERSAAMNRAGLSTSCKRLALITAFWTLAPTLAACGRDASNSSVEKVTPDLAAACHDDATVQCQMTDLCEPGLATLVYGSSDTCIERLTQACEAKALSPGANYGTTGIIQCYANQAAQTCAEWLGSLTPGCGHVGTNPNGASCRFSSQCQSGFCDQYAWYTKRSVCGVCAPARMQGESCNSACEPTGDLACVHDANGAGTCTRRRALGETCSSTLPCAPGLRCPDTGGPTICETTTPNLGDPCDDVSGPYCNTWSGLYCSPLSHACELPRIVAFGAPCGLLNDGTRATCASGASCLLSGQTGVCAQYYPDGAACTYGPGIRSCTPPAICLFAQNATSGTCQIVGGEICH